MLLEASSIGLGGTYIWGSLRKLRANPELLTILGLPDGYEVISAAAFGYAEKPLDIRPLKEKLQVKWL
jgi:nitroreductase